MSAITIKEETINLAACNLTSKLNPQLITTSDETNDDATTENSYQTPAENVISPFEGPIIENDIDGNIILPEGPIIENDIDGFSLVNVVPSCSFSMANFNSNENSRESSTSSNIKHHSNTSRGLFTAEQKAMLIEFSLHTPNPSTEEISQLGCEFNVPFVQMKSWFYKKGDASKNIVGRTFTKDEQQMLNDIYDETPNPDSEQIMRLADLLNVPYLKIKIWFNRRKKNVTIMQKSGHPVTDESPPESKISAEHRKKLQEFFTRTTTTPDGPQLAELSTNLGLKKRSVQLWFWHARKQQGTKKERSSEKPILVKDSKRKKTKRFDRHSVEVMQKYYSENKFPSSSEIRNIANQIGETALRVQNWVLIKRFTEKRKLGIDTHKQKFGSAKDTYKQKFGSAKDTHRQKFSYGTPTAKNRFVVIKDPRQKVKPLVSKAPKILSSRREFLDSNQKFILCKAFQDNPFPTALEFDFIAEKIGISDKQTKAWFANKRFRQRISKHSSIKRKQLSGVQKEILTNNYMENPQQAMKEIEALAKQLNISSLKVRNFFKGKKVADAYKPVDSHKKTNNKLFSRVEKEQLNAFFSHTPQPSPAEIAELGHNINHPYARVDFWFKQKNSRIKHASKFLVQQDDEDHIIEERSAFGFAAEEEAVLNHAYSLHPKPTDEKISSLADFLGVSSVKIKEWFNIRDKDETSTDNELRIIDVVPNQNWLFNSGDDNEDSMEFSVENQPKLEIVTDVPDETGATNQSYLTTQSIGTTDEINSVEKNPASDNRDERSNELEDREITAQGYHMTQAQRNIIDELYIKDRNPSKEKLLNLSKQLNRDLITVNRYFNTKRSMENQRFHKQKNKFVNRIKKERLYSRTQKAGKITSKHKDNRTNYGNRSVLSTPAKRELEDYFKCNPHPSLEKKSELAMKYEVSVQSINLWFFHARNRNLLNEESKELLRNYFATNPHPNAQETLKLANKLGIPERCINMSFVQTRRGKELSVKQNISNKKQSSPAKMAAENNAGTKVSSDTGKKQQFVKSPYLSAEGRKLLQQYCAKNPNPDVEEKTHLADILGVPRRCINMWFVNKRKESSETKKDGGNEQNMLFDKNSVSSERLKDQNSLSSYKGLLNETARQQLEDFFSRNPYPSKEEKRHLAGIYDSTPSSVNAWFIFARKRQGLSTQGQISNQPSPGLYLSSSDDQPYRDDEGIKKLNRSSVGSNSGSNDRIEGSKGNLSEQARQTLSDYFTDNPYPNKDEKTCLAEMLDVSLRSVNMWFIVARKRKGYAGEGEGYKYSYVSPDDKSNQQEPIKDTVHSNNSTGLNDEARELLNKYFDMNPYPDKSEKVRLADHLGVTQPSINTWFIFARKRNGIVCEGDITSALASSSSSAVKCKEENIGASEESLTSSGTLTSKSRETLEQYFKKNPYPDIVERTELAECLGVALRTISMWFCHAKKKKGLPSTEEASQKTFDLDDSSGDEVDELFSPIREIEIPNNHKDCHILLPKCDKITKDNLKKLKVLFNMYDKPTDKELKIFSVKLGLTPQTIKNWFQKEKSKENQIAVQPRSNSLDIEPANEILNIIGETNERCSLHPEFSDDDNVDNVVDNEAEFGSTIGSWLQNLNPENRASSSGSEAVGMAVSTQMTDVCGIPADKEEKLWGIYNMNTNPSLHELEIVSNLLDTDILDIVKWYEKARNVSRTKNPGTSLQPSPSTLPQHLPLQPHHSVIQPSMTVPGARTTSIHSRNDNVIVPFDSSPPNVTHGISMLGRSSKGATSAADNIISLSYEKVSANYHQPSTGNTGRSQISTGNRESGFNNSGRDQLSGISNIGGGPLSGFNMLTGMSSANPVHLLDDNVNTNSSNIQRLNINPGIIVNSANTAALNTMRNNVGYTFTNRRDSIPNYNLISTFNNGNSGIVSGNLGVPSNVAQNFPQQQNSSGHLQQNINMLAGHNNFSQQDQTLRTSQGLQRGSSNRRRNSDSSSSVSIGPSYSVVPDSTVSSRVPDPNECIVIPDDV